MLAIVPKIFMQCTNLIAETNNNLNAFMQITVNTQFNTAFAFGNFTYRENELFVFNRFHVCAYGNIYEFSITCKFVLENNIILQITQKIINKCFFTYRSLYIN